MKIIKDFKAKKGTVYNIYHNIDSVNDRLNKHHTFMLASGIAFNMIIYLIPLFLLIIYIVRVVFNAETLKITIEKLLADFLPPTGSSAELVHTIMVEIALIMDNATIVGVIGVVGLIWVSSFLMSSIRSSLNIIFEIEAKHFFVVYYLHDIALTLCIAVMIMLYSYIIPIVNFIVNLVNSFAPDILDDFLSTVILSSATIISSTFVFLFIFKFVPNKKLPRFVIFWATGISVISIEIARYVFAWYIGSVSNYGKFYGTYAVIISLAVWIYYSALIILLSAEISKYIFDKKAIPLKIGG